MTHRRVVASAVGGLLVGIGGRGGDPLPHDGTIELARSVMPGAVVVQDPWYDGVGMVPPVVADLDGDGWPDLVSGQGHQCVANCTQQGAATHSNAVVAVWPGGPGGFPAAPAFEAWTPDRYRDVVPSAAVGDTNGDGVTEVLFADNVASNGADEEGKVWLAPGGAGALGPPTWTVEGALPGMRLGDTAEALGDVNGDGYDDLLLGLTGDYSGLGTGRAVAFYGHPNGFRAAPDWVSAPLDLSAGAGLAVGDLDGDGFPDAFVGAQSAPAASGDGQVFGFRGGPGGFASSPDWTLTHPVDPNEPRFGTQLLVVPDVDGDGYDDLAVATPSFRVGVSVAGKVEVFRGGPAGPASLPAWTFLGTGRNDSLGEGLATGDVEGDGLTDLLMTIRRQWQDAGGAYDGVGGAEVALGVPGGLSATPAYVLRGLHGAWCFHGGDGENDVMERAVQVLDLDLDGRDDVLFACRIPIPGTAGYEGSLVVAYGGVDTDADGVSDALDCEPNDPAIHPGADEVGYDGVDQDCNGADDYDLDADGAQALPWGADEDDQDEAVTLSLAVTGACATSLDLAIDGIAPGGAVEVYAGIFSTTAGNFAAPHPCEGVRTGMNLREPRRFLGSTVADASGHAQLVGVPAWLSACTDRVQAIDLTTCGKSSTHTPPP